MIVQSLHAGVPITLFDAVDLNSAPGASTAYEIPLWKSVPSISWQTVLSAAPDAITIALEVSLDGTNWFALDTSTAINGEVRTVTGSYKYIRANISSVTTGTGKTITIYLVYSGYLTRGLIDVGLELKLKKVLVPPASVQTLRTVDYQILPAPGIGFFTAPIRVLAYKPITTAWTVPNGTILGLYWNNVNKAIHIEFDPANLGTSWNGTPEYCTINQGLSGSFTSFSVVKGVRNPTYSNDNQPLVLRNTHGSTDISNVNVGLYLYVYYFILPSIITSVT